MNYPIRAMTGVYFAVAGFLEGLDYLPDSCIPGEDCIRGHVRPAVVTRLEGDPVRWQRQAFRSRFHRELGPDRMEWRSYTETGPEEPPPLGPKSCQIVINPHVDETGWCQFYADVDHSDPAQDVIGAVHHGYDVLVDDGPGWARRLGGWIRRLFS